MKKTNPLSRTLMVAALAALAAGGPARSASAADEYKVLNTAQTMGTGGIDYVFADSDGRRLYIPRGNQTLVFDLDTLKSVGEVATGRAHGVAVDPKSHHAFCSSKPVVMWDTKTLEIIKKIDVQGGPDGIHFEPLTEKIYILSHGQPNITVIDSKDGSVTGTIDLGGAPEQGASDGAGHFYVDLEDKNQVAVVDVKAMKGTAHYDISSKGGGPAGLGLDVKNHLLFAMCHEPQTCVILDANDGKIITSLPIGRGTDGGGFNPATMEAFSSQGDGTLTIIKEKSPTEFEVEQNVTTKSRAKTCTLDSKNNHIIVITTERAPAPAGDAAAAPPATPATPAGGTPGAPGGGGRRGGGNNGPGLLDIIVVGK